MNCENERIGNLTKVIAPTIASVVFCSFLLAGSADSESKCKNGTVEWTTENKKIAICIDQDGNVVAQGRNTPERSLPRGICIDHVWGIPDEDRVAFSKQLGDGLMQVNSISLTSGKISTPFFYTIPAPHFTYLPVLNNCRNK